MKNARRRERERNSYPSYLRLRRAKHCSGRGVEV